MHFVRKTRRITMLVGLGATAAYFLDPDNGAARREHVLDQIRELTQRNQLLGNRAGSEPFTSPKGVDHDDDTAASLPPLDEPISPPSGDSSDSSESPERHLVAEA